MAKRARSAPGASVTLGNPFDGIGLGNSGAESIDDGADNGGSDTAGGSVIIDPADISSDGSGDHSGSDEQPRRGKRKYTRRSAGTTQKIDLNGVEATLFSIHSILSAVTRVEELALTEQEANQLAQAIGNVSQHYDISASAKTMAWTHLGSVAAMVYGPRIVAVWRNSKKPAPPENVTPSTMFMDPNVINLGGGNR